MKGKDLRAVANQEVVAQVRDFVLDRINNLEWLTKAPPRPVRSEADQDADNRRLKAQMVRAIEAGIDASGMTRGEIAKALETSRAHLTRLLDPDCVDVSFGDLMALGLLVGVEMTLSLENDA